MKKLKPLTDKELADVYSVTERTVRRWRRSYPCINMEDPREVFHYVTSQHVRPFAFNSVANVELWALGRRCEILIRQGVTRLPC